MSTINGFRARRLSRAMTMQQLSDCTGLSLYIIRRCEEGEIERIALRKLLALADALGISIEEGCRLRETKGDRQLPCRHQPRNVLENYMTYWDLTLQGMAMSLDVSVQTVSIQCGKDKPALKYICRLAEEEGVSVLQFEEM